jgi:hypothetical protein
VKKSGGELLSYRRPQHQQEDAPQEQENEAHAKSPEDLHSPSFQRLLAVIPAPRLFLAGLGGLVFGWLIFAGHSSFASGRFRFVVADYSVLVAPIPAARQDGVHGNLATASCPQFQPPGDRRDPGASKELPLPLRNNTFGKPSCPPPGPWHVSTLNPRLPTYL